MDTRFHEDSPEHVGQVAPVDGRVVSPAAPRPAPPARVLYESNSYHEAAIRTAEQARLSKLYPRLYL